MNGVVAALAGGLTTAGCVAVIWWVIHGDTQLSTGLFTRMWVKLRRRASIRRLGITALAGGLGFLITGWVIFGAITAAAVLGLPWLLATPPNRDVEILEALDRWVRNIAATLPTGRSIIDAVRLSRRKAPALIAEPLSLAVHRLDERWSTREAFLRMADELDCPDADAVFAAMILAAERGGTGASATLAALADSVQDRLRALREIEAERAKPRIVVRQVTAITLALLGAALVFGRGFFAPYGTPIGQVILGCLVAAYVGALLIMRRITAPRRRERILRGAA